MRAISSDAERHDKDTEERTDEVIAQGEDAIDRSRNLRHFLTLQRALRALRERQRADGAPPPPQD